MCSAELEAGHEVWHPRKRGAGGGETADGGSPDNSGYQDADAPRHSAHEVSITCSLSRPRPRLTIIYYCPFLVTVNLDWG